MFFTIVVFTVAFYLVIKGAVMATKYAAQLAEGFHLSKYTVGFIVVAIISIFPETFIAMNSAFSGVPSFGFGMLLGSNVADLTLIFAIIVLYAKRDLKIESKILKNHGVYPFMLFLPLLLGLDGYFSRVEGAVLIIIGVLFYYLALKNGVGGVVVPTVSGDRYKSFFMLLVGIGVLLIGSHFVVASAMALANSLKVNPIFIGMLIVGLGTTMPELFFSLEAVKKKEDSLAVGDVLGTVLADATIVVGVLALINPFSFPQKIIYVSGVFMVVASFVLFHFMRSGRTLSKREAYVLLGFWLVFVCVEFFTTQ